MIVPALFVAVGVAAGIDARRLAALVVVLAAPLVALVAGALVVMRAPRAAPAADDVSLLGGIASDLRAGRSLRGALASGFGTDPASAVGRAGRRARLGVPMAEVVEGLDEAFGRHGPLIAASLRLVDRRGGSAVDALDAAALLVREDRELSRELAAATAPARLSALVVGTAPLALLAWQAADGALSRTVAVPGGAVMLAAGATLVVGGTALVVRMARVR